MIRTTKIDAQQVNPKPVEAKQIVARPISPSPYLGAVPMNAVKP